MTNYDLKPLTDSELRAIEAKAHQLRAEAMHTGLVAIGAFMKSRIQLVGFYLSRREHA